MDPASDISLVALRARLTPRGWRVARALPSGNGFDEYDRARAEATINARMGRQEERLARFPLVWRQELPITTYREGATAFALGEEFAEELCGGTAEQGTLVGLPVEISRFVVETALERAGASVAGAATRGLSLRLQSIAATFAAIAYLALSVLRSLRWPKLGHQHAETVVALHIEAANRTRHVRKALAGRDPALTQVIFVGRFHLDRSGAEAILAEAGWRHGFALAWDWRAVLAGLTEGLRLGRRAAPAIRAAGYRPTFAQLTAMKVRIFLGTASAWRWRCRVRAARTVVFGHVGRADTILLEAAMQQGGAKTVHWMHGVSVGRAYQGVSDLCATLCAHDSAWHDEILSYSRNVHFALPKPAFRMGDRRGWAVLTNMTHYGYTYFPSVGPAHELKLVDIVAELARREGIDPASVTWKPHPVFYQRDPLVREMVTRKLETVDFHLWPEESMPFERSASYEALIVTPSGVALDMLKAGRLPVLAEFQPIDPEHVLAHLEPRGRDVDSLAQALAIARDPARAAALFDQVWEAAGPGAIGSLGDIERALPVGPA